MGALAGGNSGTVTNVYETAAVTGGDVSIVGGLAGSNFSGGTIAQSYATGNVMAGVASSAGGLVGENFSSISQSHAAGTVAGGDNASAGGLVGVNFSIVSQSYATGAVTVGDVGSAGGLVGATGLLTVDGNEATNSITNSYATGPVTGGQFSTAGGLVGYNLIGTITQSYASGAVTVGAENSSRRRTRRGQFHRRFDLKFLCDRPSVERRRQCPARRPGRRKRPGSDDRQFTGLRQRHLDRQPATRDTSITIASMSTATMSMSAASSAPTYGTITGTTWTNAPRKLHSAYTCAGGNVAVGALGSGGGFAGYNEGIITYAFATGNVTGAAGLPDTIAGDVFNNTTQIAGFVADNHGQIAACVRDRQWSARRARCG